MNRPAIATLCLSVCSTGCLPVVNTFQTAHLKPPGQVEVTASVSSASASAESPAPPPETLTVRETQFSAQANFGVVPGLEARVLIGVNDTDLAVLAEHFDVFVPIAVALKFSIIEDHLAFDFPVGTNINFEPVNYFSIHPGLIGTYRFSPNIEASASVRVSAYLGEVIEEDGDLITSGTLGLGLSTDLERWAVRPEIAIGTFDFGSSFVSVGLALTGTFGL